MKDKVSNLHIGTSGWHYEHWEGPFYPKDIAKSGYLAYYVQHLQTVEINNTFYQLPDTATLRTWRETVPEDFTFAVKASRYITHMKKLKDPQEPVPNFLERIDVLGDTLGPILFQLPPNWYFNGERLEAFLETLPSGYRYTFELRDPDWINDEAYALLEAHNAAFCIYDFHGRQSPKMVTADFVYVRLHGPYEAYRGKYDTETLSGWAGAVSTWLRQGKDVYCYFDNDEAGYAVQNALELQSYLQSDE
jgi:uncharacterized protein YecE (DUF72 family)